MKPDAIDDLRAFARAVEVDACVRTTLRMNAMTPREFAGHMRSGHLGSAIEAVGRAWRERFT